MFRRALKPDLADEEQLFSIGFWAGRQVSHYFKPLVWSNQHTCVVEVVPTKFSERVSLQQGVFLCPANVNVSFMENLANTGLPAKALKKLTLPSSNRGRALAQLRAMNITRATLFPGLEGLAQSFRQSLIDEPEEQRRLRILLRLLNEGPK